MYMIRNFAKWKMIRKTQYYDEKIQNVDKEAFSIKKGSLQQSSSGLRMYMSLNILSFDVEQHPDHLMLPLV